MSIVLDSIREHVMVAEATLGMAFQVHKAADIIWLTFRTGNKVLVCGNGGSAADAQHFSAEFVGRFEKERRALPILALTTNASSVTALSNDYGWQTSFSRQVEAYGKRGDLLIVISTSGNSENVIQAARQAKEIGMLVVGLTGSSASPLSKLCDLCLLVPSRRTARIQEIHCLILHCIAELIESKTTNG